MADIRRWTKQQEAAIRTLTAQQDRCEQELNHALEEYEALFSHAAGFDPQALWPERLRERENLTNEARTDLKNHLGTDYSERRLEFAEQQIRERVPEDERRLWQYWRKKMRTERETHRTQNRNSKRDILQ